MMMKKNIPDRNTLSRKVSSELGPALSAATIFYHEAVSGRLGLNATDTKCMGFIINAKTPITAGDVARFTGLTTGAVTGILDRLEKANLTERIRDKEDRRKVYLRANKDGITKLAPLYSSLRKSVEKLSATYTQAELAIISDFFEKSITLLNEEAERIRRK